MAGEAVAEEKDRGLSRLVRVAEKNAGGGDQQGRWCCEQLELGNILFFSETPFDFPEESRSFLLQQRKTESRHHKNIAYRPAEDRLTGFGGENEEAQRRLHDILRNYSARVVECLAKLLPDYKDRWRLDYASFRPFEEEGRDLRVRARNDLLHTDAFPTRPTNGDRILRFFTNLNPEKPRVWLTGQTFEPLAERYAAQAGMPAGESSGALGWLARQGRNAARALHLPIRMRSPYDDFMLRFHHYLKENAEFQQSCLKTRHEFPPGSCWMVFTDMVSHAVLSGQFALEQTFIVPREAMVTPERAPVRVLERLCGHSVISQ
ncbi:MAG TPA: Kdo hydroxylase family protein [Candidatus Angelobacter sp.]|nr:Kdo hydroxylase family protein [Candidatus Angelobacter sp.]